MPHRPLSLSLCVLLTAAAPIMAKAQQSGTPSEADLRELAGTLELLRGRNAGDYVIDSPNGIDEGLYVELGGVQQWITIRGEDRDNPVVLFLHGGPGDATNPWGYVAFRDWLGDFTVVQWDQRGAGRTFGRNGPSLGVSLTLEQMTQDGVELAELLAHELNQPKVILVGHSFGSILGTLIVKARPDLFFAYVGTGQVADPSRSYDVAYRDLVRKARSLGDARALAELAEAGPPPYPDGRGYAVQRRWSNRFEGADILLSSMLGFALTAPGYAIADVNDWIEGQSVSGGALVPQTSLLQATALGGEFSVPVFVIQGAEDFTTPTSLAREWVDSVRAPIREFVSIEGGGHFAVFMRSDAFLRALTARVLPMATGGP